MMRSFVLTSFLSLVVLVGGYKACTVIDGTYQIDKLVERAIYLEDSGREREAIVYLTKILTIDSTHAWAYFNRAVDYIAIEEFERATRDLENYVKLRPKSIMGHITASEAYRQLDSLSAAFVHIQSAEKEFNSNPTLNRLTTFEETLNSDNLPLEEIYFEKGLVQFGQKDYFNSAKCLTYCIDKSFRLDQSYYFRALCNLKLSDTASAIADLRRTMFVYDSLDYHSFKSN